MTARNRWADGEEHIRRGTIALMYGAWTAAIVLAGLQVTGIVAPGVLGILIVILIGVAIAAGQARVRHKLADSIVAAFETGAAESERHRSDLIAADVREAVAHVQAARRAQEVVESGRSNNPTA